MDNNSNIEQVINFIKEYDENCIFDWFRNGDAKYKINGNVLYVNINEIPSFLEMLYKYLSRSIKKLNIAANFINGCLPFFTELSELKEINVSGMLNLQSIDYLSKYTNLEKISVKSLYINKDDIISRDSVILYSANAFIMFNNKLTVISKEPHVLEKGNLQIFSNLKDLKKLEQGINYIKQYSNEFSTIEFESIDDLTGKINVVDYNYKTLYSHVEKSFGGKDTKNKFRINCFSDLKDIKKYIYLMEQLVPNIEEIEILLKNKDYDNIDELFEISKKYNLTITYSKHEYCTLEEFISMRATINYYKDLILSFDLSPVEQITFAYDIVKSFSYMEAEDLNDSRNISKIIKTGNIVCVGYSRLFSQILKELGYNSYVLSTSAYNNNGLELHARNIVEVNDDKYDIHGLYAFDATNDSNCVRPYKRNINGKEEIVESSPLHSYAHYLVPPQNYLKHFKGEKMPILNDELHEQYFSDDISNMDFSFYKEVPKKEIDDIIYNVRLAQGYTSEEARFLTKESRFINDILLQTLYEDSLNFSKQQNK